MHQGFMWNEIRNITGDVPKKFNADKLPVEHLFETGDEFVLLDPNEVNSPLTHWMWSNNLEGTPAELLYTLYMNVVGS